MSQPKTYWRMPLLNKIMILQGVKPKVQRIGVGYDPSSALWATGKQTGFIEICPTSQFDMVSRIDSGSHESRAASSRGHPRDHQRGLANETAKRRVNVQAAVM